MKMKKIQMTLSIALVLFCASLFVPIAKSSGDEYPSEDIRWVIGGGPGGGFDIYARSIGRFMEKYLPKGVHVIVENKPGAGHRIAISTVYNSKPDGYMIGMPMMPGLYIYQMYEPQKYDMRKVTWLGMILRDPRVLCVAPNSPYKSLKDLQNAKSVSFAIVGFSSETGVILANGKLGIKAEYISGHKNSNDATLALMRGDAAAVGFTYGSMKDFLKNKQVRPIAVYGSEKRLPELPDVPTLGELGHEDLNEILGNFRSIAGPPNLPADRLTYLRDVIWKAMNDKEFVEWAEKAKRDIDPKDGLATEKVMNKLMDQYQSVKEELKPYFVGSKR
jgi:tripartite-type tricarboxylate transporter receptor subunit TctC